TDHTPSQNPQDFIGTPHLGFSGSSTKQYSNLSPTEGPHSAGSPTPGFGRSGAELAHPSPPPPAPGSLLQLPGGTPSWSVLEVASGPASTQPVRAEVPERVHDGVSLPTFKSTAAATHEAESPLFQTAESVAIDMTSSRQLVPATTNDSANPLHLSAAPENSGRPAHSAEHTSSSWVPSPLPFTTPGQGRAMLSRVVPASPWNRTADFPSTLTFLQPAESHALPPPVPGVPTPPEEDSDGALPTAATDFLLSSRIPRLSVTWTIPPWKEDSVTAILRKNEKANVTVPLQALSSKEVSSLHTVNGFVSDLSADWSSSAVLTAPETKLPPPGSPPPPTPAVQTTWTVSPSPGFSSTKPETYTATVGHSELPASASKQVTAIPSPTDVYDFATMGNMKKPATTDVFWSSLSSVTGSLSTESTISGLQQQTNYDLNGHAINSTSWATHSASTTPPRGLTSADNTIKSQDFKDAAGQSVTAEGFNIQDLVLGTSTNQPAQQSDRAVVGNSTDLWPTNNNSHSRDFQTTEVEYHPSTSQRSASHLQLPAQPTHPLLLTSPSSTSTSSLQEMLSDGTDTGSQISSDIYPPPVINASIPFQSILRHHSTAESPPISTSAFSRTLSKVLQASQHPKKWTGAATSGVDFLVSSKVEPTAAAAAAAATLFLRKPSPPALSAALVAKGTGSSPLAVASGLAKNSLTTTLPKNVTNKVASGPKATQGALHTAFPFTPTYMFARTAHTTSTHTAMQGNTGTASGLLSTTHLPRKPQAMHTGFTNPTNPEMPRASTPRPLTVTAALTSMTASVKATRLPPLRTENTDGALPAASAAVVTTGKMASNLECQMSSKLLVKTVLFLTQRRVQISESLKFNIAKGLTQALRKAFHQNDVSAHVDILEHSHNLTVGYYATKGRLVYLPAVVMEMLGVYGVSNVTADLKQHTPSLQSVAVLASSWNPQPAGYFQLKTVLQFVSQSDNIQSCKFAQTMEQRLQRAFQDAERKVLSTKSNLTIQIVSTSNASQAVTLVYVVGNQSTFLNGTVASSLLSQLSAELVGFYLTYPPLTIAEPLEYPNLDISETTRDYWVITVLQGVDNSLVGLHNQSFARVMEQRLAQLFMMSQQQGRRFKRATTLGSYTVQMVKMQRVPGPKDPAELTYYTLYNGKPLLGTAAAKILSTIDSQRMALTLHHVVLLQADPVVKNPPNNLWIIAAVLAPIAVVTVIIIIITAVLCRKNKNDFKPDTMINLPQRAKQVAQ
uniref:KIAA1549 like n=1 Tax=Propithecus coquereli TaxID=379532 RepID=A0A2K6G3K9_PROCO